MRYPYWLTALAIPVLLALLFAVAQDQTPDWTECRSCHEEKYSDAYKYSHPKETGCLGCHVTHDRKTGKLLLGDEIILCQEPCHTNMGRSHTTGRMLRNPTSGDSQDVTCTNRCHDPHGSDYKHILKMKPRDLCFSCHDL